MSTPVALDRGWPTSSPQHGECRFIYPTSAGEADRVLEQAYQEFLAQRMSWADYTQQTQICWKAKHNDAEHPYGGDVQRHRVIETRPTGQEAEWGRRNIVIEGTSPHGEGGWATRTPATPTASPIPAPTPTPTPRAIRPDRRGAKKKYDV